MNDNQTNHRDHIINFTAVTVLITLLLASLLSGCTLGGSAPVDDNATRTAIAGTAFALAYTQAAAVPASTQAPVSTAPAQAPESTKTVTPVSFKNYSWKAEVVDEKGRVGLYTSLAMDQEDKPHMIYLDDERDNLKYATYEKDSWRVQSFDSPNVDGYFGSLVLDSSGTPHLVRYIFNIQWIAYTYFTGHDWPPVDFIKEVNAASTSLALDRQGEPQVAYFDIDAGELRYASHISYGGWNNSIIAKATETGKTFPVVLDANDQPHFCFYSENVGLKYTTLINNTLSEQVVDPGWSIGLYPDMVLDAKGMPHISYYDEVNKILKYAHFDGKTWEVQVVDTGGVGKYSSIAVDSSSGLVHISYWDETNAALKYAIGSKGQWQTIWIDSGKVGEYTSIALDKAGNPHISYYDKANHRLKYVSAATQ